MSEMRAILAATATRLFAEHDATATAAAAAGTWPAALWQALETAGLTHASIAEAHGGTGADLGDAMAVLRAAGAHAAPVPLAETLIAAWMLSESGLAVPPGPLTIAPMLREDVPTLARAGAAWRLAGRARKLAWARDCGALVVLARAEERLCVALVPAAEASLKSGRSLAGEPRDDVAFDVTLGPHAVAPAGAGIDLDALWRRGALARIGAMAGALETVLTLTVRYAGERVQFGRVIGKFQAVQQEIAVLAANVAAAGAAADAAIAAAETGDGAFAIAAAKARINEAAGLAAAIAHQVHGAMGFTREHALHRFTTRLWSWREEFGDESYWWAWLGQAAARAGGQGLWPLIARTQP
jgi:acyl-CoA dehydrogenase